MSDLLSTGISGLLSSQWALNTTSHNIANANTVGYSRQVPQFGARIPERIGPFYLGAGVDPTGIRRMYDMYLANSVRDANSGQSRLTTFNDLSGRINNLLGDSSTGLQPALDGFFNAVQDLANTPADTPTRQALLGRGSSLVARFHSLAGQLDQLDSESKQRVEDEVTQINGIGEQIARLNKQISDSGNTVPNDLLDKRDQLVQELSTHIGVSVIPQDNHIVNIVVGSGQPLVIGVQPYSLHTVPNSYDASRNDIATSAGAIITSGLTGGTLGGILDFRRDMIDPARNQLGRSGIALASAFNAQHRAGMDLRGQLGGDFFTSGSPAVLGNTSNTGTAAITASITSVSQLTTFDYTLHYSGTAWSLTRSDGTAIPMTGAGTVGSPFVAEGLSFQVSGSAAAGDSFLIQPTRNGASGLGLAISDPTRIAAASPVVSNATASNIGGATISPTSITNASDPSLLVPVTITFTSPTTYQVNGTGSFAYTSGAAITVNGWSATITGTPSTGDSFRITPTPAGSADNSNALLLGRVGDARVLDGGSSSLNDSYSQFVARVGITSQQVQIALDGQNALLNQSQQAQQSLSGVNLDEEATNLVRFQQSYQASAQVISIAGDIFQSLLGAIRGG